MFNLVASLACVVCIVSLWGIIYLVVRIAIRKKVMYDTFNMPNSAELREYYEHLNKQITEPFNHDDNLPHQ